MTCGAMIVGTAAILLAGFLSGCAAQPSPPPELLPAKLLLEPEPPPTPQESVLDDPPADVQAAVEAYRQGNEPPTLHDGIATRFPYDTDAAPIILCKPLRVTEILLAPGESVENAAAGDTERWMIKPIKGRVLVKPKALGIETNLIILTAPHAYHLTLKSGAKYLPRVAFYYPVEIVAAEANRKAELERRARQTSTPTPLAKLNFAYTVAGPEVPWKPVQAFDDGERVYIEMPESLTASDAPTLMVNADGVDALVNYQVEGRYYVVDRLFNRAELVSGSGKDRREITIARAGA
jgi:P-type conjugative transfer protein TrbG